MPRYEYVSTAIFDDPDFDDEGWTSDTFLLYLYLIVCPLGNGITGIAHISEGQIRRHTRLSPERLQAAIDQLGPRLRRYPDHWLWLRGRFKHACTSPNHYKAALALLTDAPDQLRTDFIAHYASSNLDKHFGCHIAKMLNQAPRSPLKPLEGATKPLQAPTKPLPSHSEPLGSSVSVSVSDTQYESVSVSVLDTPNPLKGAASPGRETQSPTQAADQPKAKPYVSPNVFEPVLTRGKPAESFNRHGLGLPPLSPTRKPLDFNNPANFPSQAELDQILGPRTPAPTEPTSTETTRCETPPEPPPEATPATPKTE